MSNYGLPSKEHFQDIADALRVRREITQEFVVSQAIRLVSRYLSTDAGAAEIINGVPYFVFVAIKLAGENSSNENLDLIETEVPIDTDLAVKESCRRLNQDSEDFHFKAEESAGPKGPRTQYMFTVKLKPKASLLDRLLALVWVSGS